MKQGEHRELAMIESTLLGYEDHGILTCLLNVAYEDSPSGQGVGGYSLDTYEGERGKGRRIGTAFGMEFVASILKAVGVDRWERLPGQRIWVLKDSADFQAKVIGIEGLRTGNGKRFLFEEALVLAK